MFCLTLAKGKFLASRRLSRAWSSYAHLRVNVNAEEDPLSTSILSGSIPKMHAASLIEGMALSPPMASGSS